MSATALARLLGAIDYQIRSVTAPEPNQIIQVNLITPAYHRQHTLETGAAETPVPLFVMGENVRIQAGPIVDQNGNLVPDGTVVFLRFALPPRRSSRSRKPQPKMGVAIIDYRIDRDGIFEVSAISEPARTSGTLVLNTQGGLAQVILPTSTPTPTATPTLVPTPTQTPQPTPSPEPQANETGYPKLTDWLLSILILAIGGLIAWVVGYKWWGGTRWAMRSALFTVIGGLLAYLLLTLGIKPIMALVKQGASWFVVQMTVVGMLFGWAFALAWWVYLQSKNTHDKIKRL